MTDSTRRYRFQITILKWVFLEITDYLRELGILKIDNEGGNHPLRTLEAETILDELILALGDRLAQIRFESLFSVSTFVEAHKYLSDMSRITQSRTPREPTGHRFRHMWAAMSAMDVRAWPPTSIAIGGKQAQDEQFIEFLVENLNGQHLWLLVQAFEALEKHYKDFYGALGYLDTNLWFCDDMGHTRVPDIPMNDLSWFQGQVRKTIARHNVDGILKNLRALFPQFATIETNEVNLALWFNVAAFFRHLIVHGQAQIPEADLVPKLTKATGHSFTCQSREFADLHFSVVSYFENRGGTCHLKLVERDKIRPPYHGIGDRFERLISKLGSHACLSYALALTHFGKRPFWEREEVPTTGSSSQ